MPVLWKAGFYGYVWLRWWVSFFVKRVYTQGEPLQILFCLVDHYEPGTGNVSYLTEKRRVQDLLNRYPVLADEHKDSFGRHPCRTWFFPPHYHRNNNLRELVSLCEAGYGEIELHLHHGKVKPDTSENLENTIRQCLREYSEFGIFGRHHDKIKYGFIHGDWALDNSLNGRYCGVNDELTILSKTGCYADFTFPSKIESNPLTINSIFYAQDNPKKPKSYNFGERVTISKPACGGLMLIQGPLNPVRKKGALPRISSGAIEGNSRFNADQIRGWVNTGICVKGKNDWVVIKVHTHGATSADVVLGNEMDKIFSYLESHFNDGRKFLLHYVTARELYNIIKAAQSGKAQKTPNAYIDFEISRPAYDASVNISKASRALQHLIDKTYRG